MEIRNKSGDLIFTLEDKVPRHLNELDLREANFSFLDLMGVSFDDSDLTGSDFTHANLYWANLSDAKCDDCIFIGADLRGAIFFRTSLQGAKLQVANFGVDMLGGHTDLADVDLSTALLTGANLTGATFNAETKFPPGFDPLKHGMIETSRRHERISRGEQSSKIVI